MVAVAQTIRHTWRRILPALVTLVFYFGLLVYPLMRMLGLAFPDWRPGTWELLCIMLGPLAGRLSYEFVPSLTTRWLAAIALTWLGVCFVSFNLVVVWELVNGIYPLPRQPSGQALLALTALISVGGFVNAQLIRINHIAITAPQQQSGYRRIAHISDVHVGSRSGRLLKRIVRKTNAAKPDCIMITGDLVDFRDVSQTELQPLQGLEAPTYFVIGNHERYVDLEAICARLQSLGIRVLRNESIDVEGMQLVGIDDAEAKTQVGDELRRIPAMSERFRVLLYHRPDGSQEAADWGAHLMLCGHTHHGQIVPFNYAVRRVFPQIRGLYPVQGMNLYVSPGTGTWGPIMRLGSRSEIGMIELTDGDTSCPTN